MTSKLINIFALSIAFLLIAYLLIILFQEYSLSNCQEGVVVELKSQLAEDVNRSRFQVALVTDTKEVITLYANGEVYYQLQIGDRVKTCQSIGEIIPINEQKISNLNYFETYIERIEE